MRTVDLSSRKRLSYRGRLFLILLLFAVIPSVVLTAAWAATSWITLPLAGATAAWDSAATSGARALAAARARPHPAAAERAFRAHEQTLRVSLARSKQAGFLFRRAAVAAAILALLAFAVLFFLTSRVAGHLSRSLSRPLQEIIGWTEHIARGQPLPTSPPGRGAPEFELLRARMRDMAAELESGRRTALEAERVSAMRETARQVAHELKNPLTPIRFAVERLRRDAAPALQESIDVLATETARLEALARSFAQFGRLPEGPMSPVDLGELARYTARSLVPPGIPVEVSVESDLPPILGHHDALTRAVTNVVLNAVDACRTASNGGGRIAVAVHRVKFRGGAGVSFDVSDSGCGIAADRLARIWDPYVTYKAGGTGLGLAIVRQTVEAHRGEVHAESQPGHGTTIHMLFECPAS